jgi:hypothetical protein
VGDRGMLDLSCVSSDLATIPSYLPLQNTQVLDARGNLLGHSAAPTGNKHHRPSRKITVGSKDSEATVRYTPYPPIGPFVRGRPAIVGVPPHASQINPIIPAMFYGTPVPYAAVAQAVIDVEW